MAAMRPSEVAELLKTPISQEMLNRDLARLAYMAKDGTPRVVPIAFTWNGSEVVMCTATNAPKLASLRRSPPVALTVDTEVHPPKILLIRGEGCSTR
jgi:nitroimidazol reductase NimA-like FMN-containing flavoprotein (pyridoxamine 5'-phosphate oxidase superfamily)